MNWIIQNATDLLAIWGALVAVCSIIVKLTPSSKDDVVWQKVLKVLDLFSVVFTKEDAEKLAQAAKNIKSKK